MNLNTHVKIILIETSSSANIGSSLRAMKTMSLSNLILVNPKEFPSSEVEALASNAKDLIKQVKVVDTLDEALEDIFSDNGYNFGSLVRELAYAKTGQWQNFGYYNGLTEPTSYEEYINNLAGSNRTEVPSLDDLRTWYDEVQSKITISDGDLLISHNNETDNRDTVIRFETSVQDLTDIRPLAFLNIDGGWTGS